MYSSQYFNLQEGNFEIYGDGIDNDCDGLLECDDPDLASQLGECACQEIEDECIELANPIDVDNSGETTIFDLELMIAIRLLSNNM